MSTQPTDLTIGLPIPRSATAEYSREPSELELQVIGLFDEFRNRLLRYVVSLGVSPFDGEEIIQEVFLALFQHLQLGRPQNNLRGWIFRVAHNLALKQRNANYKLQIKVVPNEGEVDKQLDPTPNPEEQMMGNQRQKLLRAVLRVLPEQDQCCLYLRAEGLRYREIAGILGMSLGAVSISLTRSFARFERADAGGNHAG